MQFMFIALAALCGAWLGARLAANALKWRVVQYADELARSALTDKLVGDYATATTRLNMAMGALKALEHEHQD